MQLHATFCRTAGQVEHQYGSCIVCCQDPQGCSIVREGVQFLLDNGTIKITGQRNDYHEVDMVEVCLMGEESEEEYALRQKLLFAAPILKRLLKKRCHSLHKKQN